MRPLQVRRLAYGLAALLFVALSIMSPLLFLWLSKIKIDWELLSLVGQSYGPIATLLSGAAILGVVATVRYQAKQTTVSAEQAVRQMHLELMREAWQDPDLMKVVQVVPKKRVELTRRGLFLNTYIMYLRMGWINGQISLSEVEELAGFSFSTPTGAYWWAQAGEYLKKHLERDFVEALVRAGRPSEGRAGSPMRDVVAPRAHGPARNWGSVGRGAAPVPRALVAGLALSTGFGVGWAMRRLAHK